MKIQLLHYDRLYKILRSLRSSTNMSVCFSDVKWNFSRLNSEYSSRRIVEMSAGHFVDDLVVIQNDLFWIGITKYHNPEICGDVVTIPLPYYHILGLFSFPATAPEWCRAGILRIHIPDLFFGYDNNGNPMFKPSGEIKARWKEGEQNIWEYKDPSYVGSIDDHLIYWDGSFLTITPFGTFTEGDIVSEDLAKYCNNLLDSDSPASNKLDDLLESVKLSLECAGDISNCSQHNKCEDCEYRNLYRLKRI